MNKNYNKGGSTPVRPLEITPVFKHLVVFMIDHIFMFSYKPAGQD